MTHSEKTLQEERLAAVARRRIGLPPPWAFSGAAALQRLFERQIDNQRRTP